MTNPGLGVARLLPFTLAIGILALTVVLLIQGRQVLIPIALAVLIWYLINAIARAVDHMVPGYKLPHWLGLSVALTVMAIAFWGIGKMIGGSIAGVSEAAPVYQQNLDDLLRRAATFVGIADVPTMSDVFDQIDLQAIITRIAETAASVAGRIGIILIYVLFLLLEEQSFNRKLSALFPDKEREAAVRKILHQIQGDVQTYLALKTMMSVLTGAVSYAVLTMMGVDFAAFWAFVIFLLNYIPTIGSLVGVIFPAILTIIQFNALGPFVIVLVSLGATQFAIGNVLEPRLMGNSLNLSPLVMILSLSLWGQIWGIVGMFLSVPIMVMLMIVFAHLPYTRPVAIVMSSNGKIDEYVSRD